MALGLRPELEGAALSRPIHLFLFKTVIFGEISGICKTRIQQQQTAAAEFGTFLLKTAMEANGAQNSEDRTSLAPESSFLIYSLRSIMTTGALQYL